MSCCNQRREKSRPAPNVLDYQVELIIDGRKLDRPVNYALVKIIPPEGAIVDPKRHPFVVVDPRAGHGPASAVSRPTARSELHSKPVTPAISSASCRNPVDGQTIEDIARGEAVFLEKVMLAASRCGWKTLRHR